MEAICTEVLVKSDKISQKKKKGVVWFITALLIIVTIVSFIIDYSNYKKGQEYGLASAIIAFEISDPTFLDENDSYAEKCDSIYHRLDSYTQDMTINGITYDASAVRKTEDALRSAFADIMESAGYDRYNSYSIANWFKYTNFIEYFFGCYWDTVLPICCYIVLIFTIVFTILVNRESKKELLVYNDSVLCKVNSKKSKQLFFEDINNVDFGKNSLKLVGTGVKFKISNITNVEEIKSIIIEKKKLTQCKSNSSNASNADELKKYKELLDMGVISQKEFESKKKQILGL